MDTILNQLIVRYPSLEALKGSIQKAAQVIIECYVNGGKVLICGNGGSCSDSDHIVGELMKSFEIKRSVHKSFKKELTRISPERGTYLAEKLEPANPAISLHAHSALISAITNDTGEHLVFAQQIIGYGKPEDILIGISSSGNSQNVVDAFITAKAMGLTVIGLTGETGGEMKNFCDILINVPEKRTAFVQELHLPVYHAICLMIETYFYGNQT